LISEDTRTASARAISESVVIPIDAKRFLYLVQQTPFFAFRVMRIMSARLKMMNERVTSLAER
jgi:CRP/FNR family transcriptional regulator, cyclic AMP receptor protein